jgi:hypothetical protein
MQALFDADSDYVYTPGMPRESSASNASTSTAPSLTSWSMGGGVVDENSGLREEGGFVGLLNLGATCYLNSLLQAMYLTPELRSAIYAVPDEFLASAANYAAPSAAAAIKEEQNSGAAEPVLSTPELLAVAPAVPTEDPAGAVPGSSAAVPAPNYEFDSLLAMGFELEMIEVSMRNCV